MGDTIRKLEFPLTRRGITYTLESETAHSRTVKATFNGAEWYEVFERKINKPWTAPNGAEVPASEVFPSDESFGKMAWTYKTSGQCLAKAAEIDAKVERRLLDANGAEGTHPARTQDVGVISNDTPRVEE